jgi:hypothetical protein
MKTVLQDVKTRLLFRNMDEWTSSLEDAAGFRDTVTALKFCQRNNLPGVAIVQVYRNGLTSRVAAFHRGSMASASSPAVTASAVAPVPAANAQPHVAKETLP